MPFAFARIAAVLFAAIALPALALAATMLVPTNALNQTHGLTVTDRNLEAKTMATATVRRIISVIRGFDNAK